MDSYPTEATLVDAFLRLLESGDHPWGEGFATATEFDYSRGRTDVVAVDPQGQVIAFEAKLSRWKDALHQAYRNTCFAHRSYVVLPEAAAVNASRYLSHFTRRGVGLCTVTDDGLRILHEGRAAEPLQPALASAAVAAARPA